MAEVSFSSPTSAGAGSATSSDAFGGNNNTGNLTTAEALASTPTTAEQLLGAQSVSLDSVMSGIANTPMDNLNILSPATAADLSIVRGDLVERMGELETTREQLLGDYQAGDFVCTTDSSYTLAGLSEYVSSYNDLAGDVNTYNGLVNLDNTQTLMQALPFQLAGSAILGVAAVQSTSSFVLNNPSTVGLADDFLNTLLVPGSPSPSAVGYGTGLLSAGAEAAYNLLND